MGAVAVDADDFAQHRPARAMHDAAMADPHRAFEPGDGQRQPDDRADLTSNS
ncbi:hypothetical protein ACFSZS_01225 [Seohaeicola zhoushanensis]